MKFTKLVLTAALGMLTFLSTAQRTPFDNKPYIEGEMLVQTAANADINDLVKLAPQNYELEIGELISHTMRVYMVYFNHHNVEHYAFQNWLYEQTSVVTIADYNYLIEMRATVPNDANFTQQWHHKNTGQTGGTTDADIDSDLAWDITTGGQTATNDDIVVCVIESGNLDHNDLTGNRWFNQYEIANNGIDDDGNGYIDDYDGWNPVAGNDNYGTGGHGTNCLGMIGAKGDNNLLVTGANWDVKLMVVGGYSISSQANAIAAYQYPYDMRKLWNTSGGTQGAFVVATSSSWGIDGANPASYPLWCNFYDTLGYVGIINVGATTNANFNVDTGGDMPTGCTSPYMVGVGRTDHNDNTAGGYGQTTILLGAPGINVVTTANTNSTTTTTGTSFACPLTAGVIGLAYSIPCTDFMAIVTSDPKQGADVVLQALSDGTDAIPSFSSKFITGGRLNARNTLDELMAATCTSCNFTETTSISEPTCSGGSDGSISITGVTGGTAPYTYDWTTSGNTSATETGLAAGTYSVTITDATSCSSLFSYTVTQPAAISGTASTTSVTCNGDADGAINMTVSNAAPTATYSWSPGGATTEDISGLSAGNYTLTVTDGNGCTGTINATVVQPAALTASTTTTPISFGSDGAINLSVSGGTSPYTYNWDSGFASTQDLSGLNTAGTYTCDITDANGCTIQITATVDSQLGIETDALNQLNIYPNPTQGIVNIAFKADIDADIIVYNSIGQKLIETKSSGKTIQTIDLSNFANGVYILNINSAEGTQRVERITVNK